VRLHGRRTKRSRSSALNGRVGVVQLNTVCANPYSLFTNLPLLPRAIKPGESAIGWAWGLLVLLLLIPAAVAMHCCYCKKRTKSVTMWKPKCARSELPLEGGRPRALRVTPVGQEY